MSKVIVPTVGRVVEFVAREDASHHSGWSYRKGDVLAATVCYVHHDRMVNLTVHAHNGVTFPRTNVPLVQPTDAGLPPYDYCRWMEYQKGQAAKTDGEITGLRAEVAVLRQLFINTFGVKACADKAKDIADHVKTVSRKDSEEPLDPRLTGYVKTPECALKELPVIAPPLDDEESDEEYAIGHGVELPRPETKE